MNPFRLLTEKPWQNPPLTAGGVYVAASQRSSIPPQKVALFFFLGVVSVMFGLFITAYVIRMSLDDWRPMPETMLLWINTAALFLASVVLQWTCNAVRRGELRQLRPGLILGALLSAAFVLGQYTVWQQMSAAGFMVYDNPANAFFYVLTGIHALHLLGGMWVWLRTGYRVWTGASMDRIRLSVELCALYWHFLLLVWLVLFALLSYT